MGHPDTDICSFREWYLGTLKENLGGRAQVREPYWSEAFAVGNPDWLQRIYKQFDFRRKKILSSPSALVPHNDGATEADGWQLAESPATYYIEG